MIAKHKFWRLLTRIHKWSALIIGAQIILWFASGFFMSFFSIDKVHGDHMALEKQWPLQIETVIPVNEALALYPKDSDVNYAHLRSALGSPVWEIEGSAGKIQVNGQDGNVWQGISEQQVREAAAHYYMGKGEITTVKKFDVAPKDYRKEVPVWQVVYKDPAATRLYVSPDTGELINVRTRLWRAFDFMWMLHIMDYKERDSINLWWLKLLSFCALLFSLSGLGLIIHRIFLRPKPRKKA